MADIEFFDSVVIGSGFGGTIMAITLANMKTKPNQNYNPDEKNDSVPHFLVPTFNILPGQSYTKNIEISWFKQATIVITKIQFGKHSEWFKLEQNLPLTLNMELGKTIKIPITVNIPANAKELNEEVQVQISIDSISTVTLPLRLDSSRICILERGQWWVSHEMPDTPDGRIGNQPTLREYLKSNKIPHSTWAYPDNLVGAFKILASARPINPKGVYDFRPLSDNVYVISGSGVGGGSLVYSNVTERPEPEVFDDWPLNNDDRILINDFFELAENFIGVNKIITNTGMGASPLKSGGFKLARSKVFQETALKIHSKHNNIVTKDGRDVPELDANLSITDIRDGLFSNELTDADKQKYSKQSNVCQRQGRCVLGCIPGARHTLNKQIFGYIQSKNPIDVYPLCEVDEIEYDKITYPGYKYKIQYTNHKENKKKTIYTKLLVLAAGSLGSTNILLKSKKLKLSSALGTKFSTNGDLLGVINPTKEIVDASRGPIVTSVAKFKKGDNFLYSLEDSGIPKMFAEIFAFAFDFLTNQQKMERSNSIAGRIALFFKKLFGFIQITSLTEFFNKNIYHNKQVMSFLKSLLDEEDHNKRHQILISSDIVKPIMKLVEEIITAKNPLAAPEERVSKILMLSGMGRDEPKARLIVDNGSIKLEKSYDLGQPVFDDIVYTMKQFAEEIGEGGKDSLLVLGWDEDPAKRIQFVLHPLGGCPMGTDSTNGVVDNLGRVFQVGSNEKYYEDMYVVDGSIIPRPLGINPSLTIAALSFRIATFVSKETDPKNSKILPK